MGKEKDHVFYIYNDLLKPTTEFDIVEDDSSVDFTASESALSDIFDEIQAMLKLNFSKIVDSLIKKPDKVFEISSDIDTFNIRFEVSNLEQTCFYENGRIFAYSNFLNEVVFGLENWTDNESDLTQALTILFVNYQITLDDLRDFVEGDVYEIYNNLISLLFNNQEFLRFFDVFIQNGVMHVIPRDNLIDNLLDYKRTLVH